MPNGTTHDHRWCRGQGAQAGPSSSTSSHSSGGKDARIAVIPTASSLGREVVDVYDALFTKFGAARGRAPYAPESREQAHDAALVKALDEATGVFMTGGNQLASFSSIVCGTPVGDAILRAHERGAVVAGTSAGASIQSSHMVAFGVGGSTPSSASPRSLPGSGWSTPPSSTSTSTSATATAAC